MRELQLALIDDESDFRVVGVTGNGMSDKAREHLLSILAPLNTSSEQIATDSRRIAFRPVRPEIVVEITCNDLLTETTKGSISVSCQSWNGESYTANPLVAGVSLINPVFARVRDDKKAVVSEAGMAQVTAIVQIFDEKRGRPEELSKRGITSGRFTAKKGKEADMVQKFLVWKTNKHEIDQRVPAYGVSLY